MNIFNVSYQKVGGLHFLKLGRITLMFCVSKPKPACIAADTVAIMPREDRFITSDDGVLVLGWRDE